MRSVVILSTLCLNLVLPVAAWAQKADTPPLVARPEVTLSRRDMGRLMHAGRGIAHYLRADKPDLAAKVLTQAVAHYEGRSRKALIHPQELTVLGALSLQVDNLPLQKRVAAIWIGNLEADTHRQATTGEHLLALAELLKATGDNARLAEVAQLAGHKLTEKTEAGRVLLVDQLCRWGRIAELTGDEALQQQVAPLMAKATGGDDGYALTMSPPEVVALGAHLAQTGRKDDLIKLRRFVATRYLDEPGLARAVSPQEWIALASLVADGQDAGAIKAMGRQLRTHLAEGTLPVRPLRHQELIALEQVASRLAGAEVREQLVAAWLQAGDTWKDLPETLRRELTETVLASNYPEKLTALEPRLGRQHSKATLPQEAYLVLSRAHLRAGDRRQAAEWTMRLLDRGAPEKLDAETRIGWLETLAGPLARTKAELSGPRGTKLVELLKGLSERAHEIDDDTYRDLARAFSEDEAVQALIEATTRPDGTPSLAVVRLRCWRQKGRGTIRPFLGKLTDIKKPLKGDKRALWELAAGYAMGLTGTQKVRLADGAGYHKRAIAAAETPEVCLRAIRELTLACIQSHVFPYPKQLIASMSGQFDKQGKAQLDELSKQLAQAKSEFEQWYYPQPNRAVPLEVRWRRLFGLKRQIVRMHKAGRAEEVARLSRKLQEIEG